MTDKAKPAEAMQKAAEFRERAAKYEALASEARQRGNIEMSIEFDRKAVESWSKRAVSKRASASLVR